jgi:hypothetical protein
LYKLEVGKLKYKYLASPHIIAIIAPSRKIRKYPLHVVQSNPKFRVQNGTSDGIISPEEVAAFILRHRLK